MTMLNKFQLHYLPKIGCFWFMFTCIICYFIAVANSHVKPFMPFISSCGTIPPESCIFGQMLNIGAIIMAIGMYVYYKQVNMYINSKLIDLPEIWNNAAFWTGNLVCLGISIVGNFQETGILSVHVVGGFMAFGMAALYFVIHIRISLSLREVNKKNPKIGVSKFVFRLRVLLTVLYLLLFATSTMYLIKAAIYLKGNFENWKQDEKLFEILIPAAVCEWLLMFTFATYVSTVSREFRSLEYDGINFKRCQTSIVKALYYGIPHRK